MHGLIRDYISVSFAFSVAVPFNEKERCNVKIAEPRHEKCVCASREDSDQP